MKLGLVAAIARNRVIGREGALPWRLPEDMKRFKALTMGHAVLMGRKTFESLGKPLSGRKNLVVTSSPLAGVACFPSPEDALQATREDEWVFVIGGASLYQYFLERCDALFLTLVDREPEGDTMFPPYEHLLGTHYLLQRREDHPGFHFLDYVKRP
jgi:dihydrofolate reductase